MTDYMPTTEDVKNCYVFAGEGLDGSTVKPIRVLRREFDRWLTKHDREVAEKAWDEGYSAGLTDGDAGGRWADDDNPYRTDRIEQGGES